MSQPENMNIYQKLAKIRKQVAVLKKDASGYNYKYVTEEHILANITGLMDKYGISLIPSINPGTTEVTPRTYIETKTTKSGATFDKTINEFLLTAEMTWRWLSVEKPEEFIDIPWVIVGQQSDASQSFGSALTYSSRYFLLKFFNIATSNDDPDKFRSEQKKATDADDKLIADGITGEVHKIVEIYLLAYPDNRQKVIELAEKYIKGGNYKNIKDPAVAAKLLEDASKVLVVEPNLS